MIKYIFITHIDIREVAPNEYDCYYHCNYYCRVDDLLEEFMVSQLAGEPPPRECQELATSIQHLSMVSRYNPQKKYKMSIVIFEDDQEDVVNDIIKLVDEQHAPTIKMIRRSGDTQDL